MLLKTLLKFFTGLLGLVLFAYVIVFFAAEATKVKTWQKSGTTRSAAYFTKDSSLVFRRVDKIDFVSPPFPVLVAPFSSAAVSPTCSSS